MLAMDSSHDVTGKLVRHGFSRHLFVQGSHFLSPPFRFPPEEGFGSSPERLGAIFEAEIAVLRNSCFGSRNNAWAASAAAAASLKTNRDQLYPELLHIFLRRLAQLCQSVCLCT